MRLGRIEKGRPVLVSKASARPTLTDVRAKIVKFERERGVAALMRSNPDFVTEVGKFVLRAIDGD
jgi:hypothetical protein